MFERHISLRTPLMNVMVHAVEKASQRLRRDFCEVERLQVSQKGPGDFVSVADKRTEKILFEELSKARPKFGFLMEESGEVKGEDTNHRWVIDPLDGTSNFLHGVPHFCISVALQRQHEIIAGVIFDPIKDEMFYAEKGSEAFLNETRLRVSGRRKLEHCLIATGGPSIKRTDPRYFDQLKTLSPHVACMRQTGSAALDLAYVAAGRFDGFYETHLNPWDMAAGIVLIKEAGGYVGDFSGRDAMMSRGDIVATTFILQKPLQNLFSIPQNPLKRSYPSAQPED